LLSELLRQRPDTFFLRIRSADLKLLVVDVQDFESPERRNLVRDSMEGLIDDRTIVLINKVDLQPTFDFRRDQIFSRPVRPVEISCISKTGLSALVDRLVDWMSTELVASLFTPAVFFLLHANCCFVFKIRPAANRRAEGYPSTTQNTAQGSCRES